MSGHRKRHYSRGPQRSVSEHDENAPHVTIIRPVKGLEPSLYACLSSTFQQTYPKDKLSIYLCVSSRNDRAFPTLQKVVAEHEHAFDVRLFIEEDDAASGAGLGPNPKIRNMSRAYRKAKGDIIWIIDCNVWIGKGVAGRMVDLLEGKNGGRRNKFVHQLPLVVDTDGNVSESSAEAQGLLSQSGNGDVTVSTSSTGSGDLQPRSHHLDKSWLDRVLFIGGGRLEETFMSSSHAKFYTAINTVLLAPCIVGKSNMFRKSHLNALTKDQGIDFFSNNICEDHLIGDLIWKSPTPAFLMRQGEPRWGNHAMLFGDLCIQPMAGMNVREYIARRMRWLRVRKFTVTLATLVEPGTESFLCSAYGAFAVTHLPFFTQALGVPSTLLSAFLFWLLSVSLWCAVDWSQYRLLHSGASIEVDEDTPSFARNSHRRRTRRPFGEWLLGWLGRESLAFPIWFWAVWGGVSVVWRGKKLWVGMDMRVHEYEDNGKRRQD